jgi:hypothetical protein
MSDWYIERIIANTINGTSGGNMSALETLTA